LLNPYFFIVQQECRARSAHRGHRIGHKHGIAEPAQREPEHCRIDVHAVDDQAIRTGGGFKGRSNGARIAAFELSHRVEQVGEAAEPFADRGSGLRICRHRMPETDARA